MAGFVDLHQHVLWGLDDGPKTPEEMYALLRADAADGIRVVAATCHVLPGIRPFDMALYQERLAQALEYCKEQGLPIQILSGAEIGYTPYVVPALLDRRIPTIGDTEFVLLEFWKDVDRHTVEQAVCEVFRNGFRPIIAHIERYKLFHRDVSFICSLKEEYGALCQVNCDFILQAGMMDAFFLRRLQRDRIPDLIATDAHGASRRPPRLEETYRLLQSKSGGLLAGLVLLDEGRAGTDWQSMLRL